jgi:uncharacterized membrane protein (UPF0127 family)
MRILRRAITLLLAVLLAVLLAACSGGADTPGTATPTAASDGAVADADPQGAGSVDSGAPESGLPTAEIALVSPDGATRVPFTVELAVDPPTRQRGLMERTELADGAGMLFLFPDDSSGGFWMRNTLIPLQIAYIGADGEVVDILDMVPCEEDPCEVYTPGSPYRSALEVDAGALDAAGVEQGWRLESPADLPPAT